MCTLPKRSYCSDESWVDVKYVIPEYAFMAQCSGVVSISDEHSELGWVSVDEAHSLLNSILIRMLFGKRVSVFASGLILAGRKVFVALHSINAKIPRKFNSN